MPGKKSKLPTGITLRKDGRYMWRFKHDYVMYQGTCKKLEDAKKALNTKRYEVEHGINVKVTKITVDDWFNTWMQEYKLNSVKYGTYNLYGNLYRVCIQESLGKKKLQDVRPEHIQKLYNDMIKTGYSHGSVKLVNAIMHGMLKQAFKNQLVTRNVAELVTMPKDKEGKKEVTAMTTEEQKIFLDYAKAFSPYYNLYVVALFTGMRSGELRALEWSDIDFDKEIIHVTGTLKYKKGSIYFKDSPKTKSSERDIPIVPEVKKILKAQRVEQNTQRLSMGDDWQPLNCMTDRVFGLPVNGDPIYRSCLGQDIKHIVSIIKLNHPDFPRITPHTLRHTFATRGLEQGIPPKIMQALLGHSTIAMTLDTYSHVLPDTKAEEIQKISGLF